MTGGEFVEYHALVTGGLRQNIKFDAGVADDTGVGCAADSIFAAKIIKNRLPVFLGTVNQQVFNTQLSADVFGLADVFIMRRKAAFAGQAAKSVIVIPDGHCRADDLMPFLF